MQWAGECGTAASGSVLFLDAALLDSPAALTHDADEHKKLHAAASFLNIESHKSFTAEKWQEEEEQWGGGHLIMSDSDKSEGNVFFFFFLEKTRGGLGRLKPSRNSSAAAPVLTVDY